MSTSSGQTIKSALRARPPATIICENSPTSTWIDFLKDEVLPLLKERESNITVYHAPIGFKTAKARKKYVNHLKNMMGEVPEKEQEELKQLIAEDIGLLELATNAGRDIKKRMGTLFIVHSICNSEGQLGVNRIRLMAKMTPHQLLSGGRNIRYIKSQER
jgi:hypothetical protein